MHLDFNLKTYVDTDYAHNAKNRRSVSGVAVFRGGTLMSWLSRTRKRTHKRVTRSATEAEHVNTADGVKQVLYAREIQMFLIRSRGPINRGVYEDDKGAIDLVKTSFCSFNSKYIDVRHGILREMASSGDISVQYIQSRGQHADTC